MEPLPIFSSTLDNLMLIMTFLISWQKLFKYYFFLLFLEIQPAIISREMETVVLWIVQCRAVQWRWFQWSNYAKVCCILYLEVLQFNNHDSLHSPGRCWLRIENSLQLINTFNFSSEDASDCLWLLTLTENNASTQVQLWISWSLTGTFLCRQSWLPSHSF